MSAPVIKWPGSKWRIADWILANMPSHDCYLEPFFGSGAVFFNKPPSSVETINDLDSLVVNLFRVIRDDPAALEAAIALTPWARSEYDDCRRDLGKGDDVEQARRLLVAMWQTVGLRRASTGDENSAGNCGWRARDSLHQSPVKTWQRLPERVRMASTRLMDAQIENRPAIDIIRRYADSDVLIYADPPYVSETRGVSKKNGTRLYAHEMSDEAHVELIDALRAHPGPALLSGYHCDLYERLLPWQRVQTNVRIQNQTRCETLYINEIALARLEKQREQQTMFA